MCVNDFCSFLRFLRTSTFSLRTLAISKIWPRNQGGQVPKSCESHRPKSTTILGRWLLQFFEAEIRKKIACGALEYFWSHNYYSLSKNAYSWLLEWKISIWKFRFSFFSPKKNDQKLSSGAKDKDKRFQIMTWGPNTDLWVFRFFFRKITGWRATFLDILFAQGSFFVARRAKMLGFFKCLK